MTGIYTSLLLDMNEYRSIPYLERDCNNKTIKQTNNKGMH